MVFPEFSEYKEDMLDVFFMGCGVNEDIIDVDNYELVKVFSEDFVHVVLKDGRTVG